MSEKKTVNKTNVNTKNETPVEEVKETPVEEPIVEEKVEEVKTEPKVEPVKESAPKHETKKDLFSFEEKQFITHLIACGYQPVDIIKRAQKSLNLSEQQVLTLTRNSRRCEDILMSIM